MWRVALTLAAIAALCSGATVDDCLPGTYFKVDGAICQACSAGTYQPNSAQMSCEVCQQGSTSAEGASACEPCPAGTHQPVAGQNCLDCAAGTFAPLNSTVCHWCLPGSVSEARAAACVTCAAGSYAVGAQAAPCTPCPVGTALAVAGGTSAANCTSCANDTYAAHAGAASCEWCNGTLLEGDGSEAWAENVAGRRYGCKHQCGPGQFLVHDVAQRLFGCPMCVQGKRQWAAVHQHEACEACPALMSTRGAGAEVCECDVAYEKWNRSDFCEECNAEEHFFKAHVGNESCRKCSGEHTIVSSAKCSCGAGYYYEEGKVFCKLCPWWKTTSPGAVGAGACTCDLVKNMQACGDCGEVGCKCRKGYKQDLKRKTCAPCAVGESCSGLLSGAGRRREAAVFLSACVALLALAF